MRIEELRSTLEGRAEEIGSGDVLDRVGSVHGRVETVRRRRRTAVVATAVVALAAGAAGIVPVLDHRPPAPADAPDRLAGLGVPRTETAAGFTYRYVRGLESAPGADSLKAEVGRSDRPTLVMWASSDPDPDLTLRDRPAGAQVERSLTPGFERFSYLDPGVEHRLVLTGSGASGDARLAMAVYEMVEQPPPGVSNGQVTFRRQVLDQQLLGAAIEKPGVRELSFDIRVPEHGMSFVPACYGGATRWQMMYIRVDGKRAGGVSCDSEPSYDPVGQGSRFETPIRGLRPGSTVTVTARLEDQRNEKPVGSSDAVIGLGVYAESARVRDLAGWRVPVASESAGHEYVAELTRVSGPGEREVTVRLDAVDYPRLVTLASTGTGSGRTVTSLLVDGREEAGQTMSVGDPTSLQTGYVVQPGTAPTLTYGIRGKQLGDVQLGLMVSRQVH
ncbi:hypothetical protein [Nocardioides mesophilus]|uniref:Uncharacterized protein n=1 Tax=Nocardioides mesophilus TaxID=433659 RepID=A0A7G9RFC6_9ACTN|nr:hypothetical protein [Nocardioides mesophilus]QNN54301.1 hypothetical protein H9L09_08175 [Nocardioides mesophilus]